MNPYPGLRPFESEEKNLFFGRGEECSILVDKVLASRLTLLFAASGVGKTSLLRAALIPQLTDPEAEHLDLVLYRDWVDEPLAGLKRAVADTVMASGRVSQGTFEAPNVASISLVELCELCVLFVHPPLVLVLDQFEELFRYQRGAPTFEPFLQELGQLVNRRSLPVSLVLSMREDFALELNALKPFVPGPLFGNYFRLEHLPIERARLAIERPAEQTAAHFEAELTEALLKDLADRPAEGPFSGSLDGVEHRTVDPPYLQIVCSELWKLEEQAGRRIFRMTTYVARGRAQGLLKDYFGRILGSLAPREKALASRAFDHLVTRRGTKMAYTAADLAAAIRADERSLETTLAKLETANILRRQSRRGVLWYELHHDLFSPIVEAWNTLFKSRQRRRRIGLTGILCLLAAGLLRVAYDATVNLTTYHLRLDVRPDFSPVVEVYRGKPRSWDLLGLTSYVAESGIDRSAIEPIRTFETRVLEGLETAELEPAVLLKARSYLEVPWRAGHAKETLALVANAISDNNPPLAGQMATRLSRFGSLEGIELLRQELNAASSKEAKKEITRALSRSHSIQAALVLEQELSSANPELRAAIAAALGELGFRTSLQSLVFLLDDPSPLVQEAAASSLGWIGDRKAVAPLIAKLSDPTSQATVRQSAIIALGNLASPDAAMPMVQALDDSTRLVREAAAASLGKLAGNQALELLIERLESDVANQRSWAAHALALVDRNEAARPLIARLRDEDAVVRQNAASALGSLHVREALAPLLRSLDDPNWNVRSAAVGALRSLGSTAAIRPAVRMLQDPAPSVRSRAVQLLGFLGTSEVSIPVSTLLWDPVAEVQSSAAFALGGLGGPDALNLLVAGLNSGDWITRMNIIRALVNLGDPESADTLKKMLDDSNADVRKAANRGLFSLGRADLARAAAEGENDESSSWPPGFETNFLVFSDNPQEVASQIEKLDSKAPWERRTAALRLAILGDLPATEALLENLDSRDPSIGVAAASGLAALGIPSSSGLFVKLLRESNSEVRARAATILGQSGDRQAIQPLIQALDDPAAGVRLSAATALASLKAAEALEPLSAQLVSSSIDARQRAVLALGALQATSARNLLHRIYGEEKDRPSLLLAAAISLFVLGDPRGVGEIEAAANSDLSRDRAQVAYMLGEVRAEAGIPFLERLLTDPQIRVRQASITALGLIDSPTGVSLLRAIALDSKYAPGNNAQLAVDALRRIGTQDAITALQEAARSNEPIVGYRVYRYLGDLNAVRALPQLSSRLQALEKEQRGWRTLRDHDLLGRPAEEIKTQSERVVSERPPAFLGGPIAYSIARLDREAGIRLLGHDLAKVREGAAYGLAQAGDPALVARLDQARTHDQSYPFRAGAFRAIDLTLRYIAWNGSGEEGEALRSILTVVQDREAVCTRIEFTIQMLDRENPIARGACASLLPPNF